MRPAEAPDTRTILCSPRTQGGVQPHHTADVTGAHTPQWRMDHLHTTILPQLQNLGVDSRLEHQLLVNNPRRVLAGE